MTDTNKEKCKCCLFIGIIVLVLGLISWIMAGFVFQLTQILAIIVGIVLILFGLKAAKVCKCHKSEHSG